MMKRTIWLVVAILFTNFLWGHGKREFRGAWIQTVFQEEYAEMSSEQMRKEFVKKLDFLQQCGINAIIFQVRPEADAWYHSNLEPWSRFCTGLQGVAPLDGFDPMAFLIEECRKRNMEFHAWLNPFRAATSGVAHLIPSHVYFKHPEWFVFYNNQLLFDPGIPECRQYICDVVYDIVSRYDVDAIHMDDYFYPYPVKNLPFPDDKSFQKYGLKQGYHANERAQWRRENVNELVFRIKQTIVQVKPWVRFGISPFGIYRNRRNTIDGSGSNTNGLQNYDDLYADINLWTQKKWIDYNIPQLYWEIGHKAADYNELIAWWSRNTNGTPLYIGQNVERTMKANDLTQKMALSRSYEHVSGNCFWPANELLWNNQGIVDSLKNKYHKYPALIPPYDLMSCVKPDRIKKLRFAYSIQGYRLTWKAKKSGNVDKDAHYFVVYRFRKGEKQDLSDPSKIIGLTSYTQFDLVGEESGSFDYIVTACNRFHQESKGQRFRVHFK